MASGPPFQEREYVIPTQRKREGFGGGSQSGGGGSGRGRGGGEELDDQTPIQPTWPGEIGTGVALNLAQDGETGIKRVLPGVTHQGLLTLGRITHAVAVKWIAPSLASEEQVVASRCANQDVRCVSSCVSPGCVCNTARQRCE